MPKTAPDTPAAQHLQNARTAAQQGLPDVMLEELTRSGFLDGAVHGLERKWSGQLPRTEIEDAVAVAVDSAYATLRQGKPIRELGAWLWKAADNEANDRWHHEYARRQDSDGETPGTASEAISDDARAAQDGLADHRRAEALRWARRLLPRIGQGQVVAVMEVLIDAVEKGVTDLPAAVIADTLGINEDAARTLLSRGLSRLKREAQREGISFPEDLGEIEQDLEGADGAES
jgi:DNA-directed RNA polymerase specialized sigma24 family protein